MSLLCALIDTRTATGWCVLTRGSVTGRTSECRGHTKDTGRVRLQDLVLVPRF